MILHLSIRNYALIESLDLSPAHQLSIITGETGAGKSIMLGAIGLLMGHRADTKVLWNDQVKCTVEGTFGVAAYKLEDFFDENDLDYDDECIIRREISPSGKSRAFINDTPVTLNVLKALSPSLLDIHSQHDGLLLAEQSYQLNIVDTYSQHPLLLDEYKRQFAEFAKSEKHLNDLLSATALSTQDYKRFVLAELEEAELEKLNVPALEAEQQLLEHAEEITQRLREASHLLDESEIPVLSQLSILKENLSRLSSLNADFSAFTERVQSALLDLKDLHSDLQRKEEDIIVDPERILVVSESLDKYNRLTQKHQVSDIGFLLDIRDRLVEELSHIDNKEATIKEAETVRNLAYETANKTAKKLSQARQLHAIELAKSIENAIHKVGIENGQIEFKLTRQALDSSGSDKIQILFSANKGLPAKPLRDVASGGEFSRLIFVIKYLIATKKSLPTIIFDEIDTGVSGEIALKMIQMMKAMSKRHQVISISHLPQFAAGGDKHFFVYKDNNQAKTITQVKELNDEERVSAIATMIAGDKPSASAYKNAQELIESVT
jgi:DNA repair protein RecN (Recombination protein N)